MITSFAYFSDTLNADLVIEISIGATKDESWVNEILIFDLDGNEIVAKDLGVKEVLEINAEADNIAYEMGPDAYQAYLESRGDHMHDQMVDFMIDEENN